MEHEVVFRNPSTKNIFLFHLRSQQTQKDYLKDMRFQSLVPFHVVSKVKLNIYFTKSLPQLKQHLIILGV